MAFSFNTAKNMNIGKGGAVLTINDRFYARALNFHNLGLFARGIADEFNEAPFVGVNMKAQK